MVVSHDAKVLFSKVLLDGSFVYSSSLAYEKKSQTPMLSLTFGCCSSPFFPASSSAALSESFPALTSEWIRNYCENL